MATSAVETHPGPDLGNIGNAPKAVPEPGPHVKRAKYLDWAGVTLARLVLYMMAVFVLIMVGYMILVEQQAHRILDAAFAQFSKAAADSGAFRIASHELATHQQGSREFLQGILNTVLLNVLLPVLTALLGYVFGKQSLDAESKADATSA